jgi:hypothetical protein
MKKSLFSFLAIVFTSSVAWAGFNLPNTVHEASEMSKASELAKTKGKSVAILVSDKSTTCPICIGATLTALRELKSKSEVVYVKSGDTSGLPDAAKNGLNQANGKYLPSVVILDATLTTVIASFGYNDDASFKKAISEAEKKIRAAKTAPKS